MNAFRPIRAAFAPLEGPGPGLSYGTLGDSAVGSADSGRPGPMPVPQDGQRRGAPGLEGPAFLAHQGHLPSLLLSLVK